MDLHSKRYNKLKKKLFNDSFIYIFSDIINKALPFLLLPIFTNYLSPFDYGIISSFTSFFSLIVIFIGLSVHGAVNVNYYKLSKYNLSTYISNILILLLISTFFSFFLISISYKIILKYFLFQFEWLFIGVLMSFFLFVTKTNLTLWIADQNPKYFAFFNIFETIVNLIFSLFLIVILGMHWEGRLTAIATSTFLMGILSIIFLYTRGYLKFQFNKEYFVEALKFGVPLIPHELGFWLRNGAIIILISTLVGSKATGLYTVAFYFSLGITVLVNAFKNVWQPYLYRNISQNITYIQKINIIRFSYIAIILMFFIALIISVLSEFIITSFLNEKYIESNQFVSYLVFATAFQGAYSMVVDYIFFLKKTKLLSSITFSISVLNIALAYFLIKTNGAIGAAQSGLVAFALSFLIVWYYSNRLYPMPWFDFKNLFNPKFTI